MARKHWIEDGKTHYQVDWTARSRFDKTIRVQKRAQGILEESEPELIEKKLARIEARLGEEAMREVSQREGQGITWGCLVERWEQTLLKEAHENEMAIRAGRAPGLVKGVKSTTAETYVKSVVSFTTDLEEKSEPFVNWTRMPATEITPADVEDLFRKMTRTGYSNCRQYNVKVAISKCFRFGIMKRLLKGVTVAPTYGFGISRKESKRPEILNLPQVDTLLQEAKRENHPWQKIWEFFYQSGARSGEAYELRAKDIDRVERRLTFERKYNFQNRQIEGLKDGEWRQVPINEDLDELFVELGIEDMKPEDLVLPRIVAWKNGGGAAVLREFCDKIGIPSVCMHTLRACWATHLLRNGVDRLTVMKMGGWSSLETMERYIRLAGVEIMGATDSLSLRKRERPARVLKLVRQH